MSKVLFEYFKYLRWEGRDTLYLAWALSVTFNVIGAIGWDVWLFGGYIESVSNADFRVLFEVSVFGKSAVE